LITGAAVTPRAAVVRRKKVVNCIMMEWWSERDQAWIMCLMWLFWYLCLFLWCRAPENRGTA
jgi:hypothetical protein